MGKNEDRSHVVGKVSCRPGENNGFLAGRLKTDEDEL